MKLLLMTNAPYTRPYGGASRSHRFLAENLAARGHSVTAVAPCPDSRGEFTLGGVRVQPVRESADMRRVCVDACRTLTPDWVLVSSEDPLQILLQAALETAPGRVVYLAHTPRLFPFGPASLNPGATRTGLIRQTAAVIAISRTVGDYVHQWTGLEPLVCHPPHFAPELAIPAADAGGAVLLMNASEVKGISIFRSLALAMPGVRFRALPGSCTTARDLESLAGLGNVEVAANRDDLNEVFAGTAVLLMPSLWMEGFGMAAVDAMLRGVPVLASALAGLEEAALEGARLAPVNPIERFHANPDSSLLPLADVPSQDIGAWQRALERILHPSEYAGQSQRCREAALRFAGGLSMDPIESLLLSSMARASGGAARPLAGLSPAQRGALMLRLRENAAARTSAGPQAARPAGPIPLSFAQQRLWFLDQLEPGNPAYVIPAAIRVHAPLDAAALRKAWRALAGRHEILRTVYRAENGVPRQEILTAGPPFRVISLTEIPAESREREARRIARDETFRPLGLSGGPPVRLALLQLGEADSILLVNLHHIAADGWSMAILWRDLAALYRQAQNGGPDPLPPLPMQYADYALAQLGDAARIEQRVDYFVRRLAGVQRLDLPYVTQAGFAERHAALETFLIPEEVAEALREFASNRGATLFMALLTVLKVVLHRYSGQPDIAIGTPVANRLSRETKDLIGCFVNTVVLRTAIEPSESFEGALARVRRTAVEAFANQEAPFERIVEKLSPERDLGRNPLFDVLFAMQNADSGARAAGPAIPYSIFNLGWTTSKFDLTFSAAEVPSGLACSIEFDAALFDAAAIGRMAGHLRRVAQAALRHPRTPVAGLPMLSPEEERSLRGAPGPRPAASAATLHELFERQAALTPQATAVRGDGESWTYATLLRHSRNVAAFLRERGCPRESLIGIRVPRSLEMLAAALGVLQAGCAYLPLDPAWPAARMRMIEEQASPALVLDAGAMRRIPAHPSGPGPAALEIPPYSLAYVLFTSGSTGTPKGVMVEHRNAVALIEWGRELAREAELFPMLASTSLCFDLSVFELFLPLACGGAVALVDSALSLEGLDGSIAAISTVPSAAAELLRLGLIPPGVRTMLLAGEPLSQTLADGLYAAGVNRVYDLYGPTETTTYSTFALRKPGEPPNIGRPVSGTSIYLLDASGGLAPEGAAGEIAIGGAGVTRGYWRDPELTARKFMPDADCSGGRLFRSGDRARLLPGGALKYAGRRDALVKVRGYRIELGEIEAHLRAAAGVGEAAAISRGNGLEAYYSGSASPPDVLAYLRGRLPAYMVPQTIHRLPQLPFTPSGKVDRRALALLAPENAQPAAAAPLSPTEEILAGIWSALLRIPAPRKDASFFESGGHSLLATQLAAHASALFGVTVPLRTVFERSTLSELAASIDELRRERRPPAPPLAQRGGVERPVSFAQRRLWFLHSFEPSSSAYHIGSALRVAGDLDVRAVERAFQQLVERHEILRTRFVERDGTPWQRIESGIGRIVRIVDAAGAGARAEEEARRIIRELAAEPFDLAAGPLLRFCAIRIGVSDWALAMVLHHIVADGWSMSVLVREMSELYAAARENRAPRLAPLPVQYGDYAEWQMETLSGERLAAEVDYWRRKLAGLARLELPTLRTRPPVRSRRGAAEPFALTRELSEKLLAIARQEGVTLYMLLLAVFQILLWRYTGQQDVAVGSPIAGRERMEIEGLIGFFVNTVVLRSRVRGERRLREFLREVRETALEAYTHQQVPFEKLVEELALERDLSRTPLFEAMLNVANMPEEGLVVEGAEWSWMEPAPGDTKFDLAVTVQQRGGVLSGVLEYNRDLFAAETMSRMARHAGALLEEIAQGGLDQRLEDLRLWDEEEAGRRRGLARGAERELGGQTVEGCIAAVAQRAAERPAVSWEHGRLSYGELFQWAGSVAGRLRRESIPGEELVGLAMERSAELIAGMLGVWMAGLGYVPVEPSLPTDRRRRMLKRAGVRRVLTAERWRSSAPSGPWEVVTVEEARGKPAAADAAAADRESIAYVLYTSGSTGEPKGVAVRRRGLWNLAVEQRERFRVGPEDRVLQFASPGFDASVWETVMALCAGAELWVGERENWNRAGVTVATLPPVVLEGMAPEEAPGLRMLVMAGERCPEDALARWGRSGVRVFNAYGPTETTVCATVCEWQEGTNGAPIGGPVGNTQAYVLDSAGNELPVGAVGEIWVGGEALARGYWGDAGQTAERWRPDGLSGLAGARMYGTGDYGRIREDGALEYAGRKDRQVKVRGQRVELEEIERVLEAHANVTRAAVVWENGRLEAWVESGGVEEAALREHAERLLPGYAAPQRIHIEERLPETVSGKIDRSRLRAGEKDGAGTAYEAPAGEREAALAAIWEAVLGAPRVGRHDNFFGLGGDSIAAIRLIARCAQAGMPFSPRQLFEHPSVATLAEALAIAPHSGRGAGTPALPPLIQGGVPIEVGAGPAPLSPGQEQVWIVDQLLGGPGFFNVPHAILLTGDVDEAALRKAVRLLGNRHDVLHSVVADTLEGPMLSPCDSRPPFTAIHLAALDRDAALAQAHAIVGWNASAGFDTALRPAWRALWIRVGPRESILAFTIHHLIADEWSLDLLVRDLAAIYSALRQGGEFDLPAPAFGCADFLRWQRRWMASPAGRDALRWWLENLQASLEPFSLPGRLEAPGRSFDTATEWTEIPAGFLPDLRAFARELNCTTFLAVLAAFQIALAQSGVPRGRIATLSANRGRPEFHNTAGLFLNTIVLPFTVDPNCDLDSAARAVREQWLWASEREEFPFETLMEELASAPGFRRDGFLPVLFVLQAESARVAPAALASEPFGEAGSPGFAPTSFDWIVVVRDSPDLLSLRITYKSGKYRARSVREFLARCVAALEPSRSSQMSAAARTSK